MGLSKKLRKLKHLYKTEIKPKQDAYWDNLTDEQKAEAYKITMETFEEFKPYRQAVNEEFL